MKSIVLFLLILFSLKAFSQDTVVVQIVHGSKPRKQYKDEFKTIGGKKGGHVVIQIDQYVYGFHSAGNKIHIFPHKKKNSVFQKQSLQEWSFVTKEKKVTQVFIPLTSDEKMVLLNFYNHNLIAPDYDYAFFGQRCASSTYCILTMIDKLSAGNYYFKAFYPGQLRKTILKQNSKNKYLIVVKAGSKKRIWEGE